MLCCKEVEKFNILLKCLLTCTHPITYTKCIGSGIQNTGKLNQLLSAMTVCRHGFHNRVMGYMLQFGAIHRIFVAWLVFVKAIFPCLNLKPDDGFLSYNIPDVLIKLDVASLTLQFLEMSLSQFCTKSVFGANVTYIYCVLEWNRRPSTMAVACIKYFFRSLE